MMRQLETVERLTEDSSANRGALRHDGCAREARYKQHNRLALDSYINDSPFGEVVVRA
jgi:hypothetical protein